MKRAIASDSILYRTDKSVLERQRECLKYHNQLDQAGDNSNFAACFSNSIDGSIGPDPGWENGWSCFGLGSLEMNYGTVAEDKEIPSSSSETWRSGNFKKRKLESVKGVGALMEEDGKQNMNKKMTGVFKEEEEDDEERSKITEENIGSTTKSITKKKKVIKEQQNSSNGSSKSDYIHVRARRGQATDSHSLAERVRREKISERMKFLQDLVPGCNKITGKAGMLDEIINYVQSLQSQIEFLSMKLAAVDPRPDFEAVDDIFGKEIITAQTTDYKNVVMPSQEMVNSGYLQFNPIQQVVQSSEDETTINMFDSDPSGEARPIWDSEMQNLYSSLGFDQGLSPLPTYTNCQPLSGSMNTNNLKMEM